MKSLSDNSVWDVVPLLSVKQAIGSKWVYKVLMDMLNDTRQDWLLRALLNNRMFSSYAHVRILPLHG